MFELPEYVTLARQINESLAGKQIEIGCLGNSPHKFVWYNRSHDEFTAQTRGKVVGEATARGRWLFTSLLPGYVLLFGECGGKLMYHPPGPGTSVPAKYHLLLRFTDGSALTETTQMWGAMELYPAGAEQERQYVKGMRPTPLDPGFTFEYFTKLIEQQLGGEKRSAKGLLTQEQLIPGLGNSIAQDILFRARIHPKRAIAEMDGAQRSALYEAILSTLDDAIAGGGRSDEVDLYGRPGGYRRVMHSGAAGRPCPVCGTTVEKIQYLGGACYFCPCCQA